jgi:hypothetical protein
MTHPFSIAATLKRLALGRQARRPNLDPRLRGDDASVLQSRPALRRAALGHLRGLLWPADPSTRPLASLRACPERSEGMTHPFPIAATLKRLALGRMRGLLLPVPYSNASSVGLMRRLAIPGRSPRFAWGPAPGGSRRYILSIMAWPKPEHDTCLAPGMSRAKS